jgi:putative flippase GtrA
MTKLSNKWFSLTQPIRFTLLSIYNTLLGYMIFAVLTYAFKNYLWVWVILLIATVIGTAHNFVLLKIFVFQTKGHWINECFKNYYLCILIYVLNTILIYIFIDFLSFNIYIAQVFCSIILTIINYFVMKYFAFKSFKK